MRGRGVLASLLSALLLPLLMNAMASAGTDTGSPGIAVTSPSPSGFTSYGGIRLQAVGASGPTFDEWLGVGDLTPNTNRVETNFTPASFLLNGNSGATAVDCNGNYAIGTTTSPARNTLTLTWDSTANTLTSRFVTPTLDCTTLFRNFAQELATAKSWTLTRAQTELTDVNALRITADDRQSGSVLTMTGGTVDGSAPLGTLDPGVGATNTWLATDYDFDSPTGFTLSGALNLGGTFGSCEATCALEIKFGHFTPPNRPPVVSAHAADATGDHGDTLTTHGAFTDPDGDPLLITGSGAGDVTDNGDGTWSWRYVPPDDGGGSVSVTASDGKGGTATDVFSWTAVNAPPVVDEHAADAIGGHNDALSTHGSFTDPDGDPLTISGSGAGTVTDNGDGTWSWTSAPSVERTGSVSVTASDGLGGTATDTFTWTAVNAPPVVDEAAADVTGHEADAFATQGSFTDPDADQLLITGSGVGDVTDNGDGTWSWTYVPSDDGNGSVTVTASDGMGGTATDTFTWSSANVAPSIVSLIPDATRVLAGTDVTWTAVATDPGTADTFTWWFDGGGGLAGGLTTTYTRRYDDCGAYPLHARIADDDGGSAQATSDATVTVVRAAALSPVDPSSVTTVNTGQVLPVKVFVGCGSFQADLQPTIELLYGGDTYAAESPSSADTPGLMRADQGQYQYNLRVPRSLGGTELAKGDLVTVRVRPFGPDGGALRIVLQIRK
jgi:Bacterial Ig domain